MSKAGNAFLDGSVNFLNSEKNVQFDKSEKGNSSFFARSTVPMERILDFVESLHIFSTIAIFAKREVTE